LDRNGAFEPLRDVDTLDIDHHVVMVYSVVALLEPMREHAKSILLRQFRHVDRALCSRRLRVTDRNIVGYRLTGAQRRVRRRSNVGVR
jgi:hypothetical protein